MERIWAPWRIEYITQADKIDECIFCRALKNRNTGNDDYVLIVRKTCFAMLNKYPYNNGHLMVAPTEHVGDMDSLSREVMADMMELTRDCQRILTDVMKPEGFNIGINCGRVAGAGVVDHIHIHIVPRWNGDTNFMPVIADTKVMPQALKDTQQVLKSRAMELTLD